MTFFNIHVQLPLAWPGILTGLILTFVHSAGCFTETLGTAGNSTQAAAVAIVLVLLLAGILALPVCRRLNIDRLLGQR